VDHRNAGRPVIQDRSSVHRFKRLHLTRASVRRASGFVLTGTLNLILVLLQLWPVAWRPPVMKKKSRSKAKRTTTRSILRLPDLEHAKAGFWIVSRAPDAKRGYSHAIDEFVDWYCSEPRLAFNRTGVRRYRSHLESRQLAPGTINLRLGAVRRLAYEAADCGLLSADSAAGIRRVKGVTKLGVRLGNWLTAEQVQSLWLAPDCQRLKGKRDRAPLALLLACGLTLDHLQQREEHWAIVDLVSKAGHVRTVPVPDWVKRELDGWLAAAAVDRGKVFRRVTKVGRTWGDGMTEKSVLHIVKEAAKNIGLAKVSPHDLRSTCTRLCHASGGELEQIQFLLEHVSVQTAERYLGCKQRIRSAVNDRIGIEPNPWGAWFWGRIADQPETVGRCDAQGSTVVEFCARE
jgi:integrase